MELNLIYWFFRKLKKKSKTQDHQRIYHNGHSELPAVSAPHSMLSTQSAPRSSLLQQILHDSRHYQAPPTELDVMPHIAPLDYRLSSEDKDHPSFKIPSMLVSNGSTWRPNGAHAPGNGLKLEEMNPVGSRSNWTVDA